MSRHAPIPFFMSLPLDRRSAVPLYRQLYNGVRDAILDGDLEPGSRLPATRTLAVELGVSRNTTMNAFEQLLAEGYIVGRVGSGSYVSRSLPEHLLHASPLRDSAPRPAGKRPKLSQRGALLVADRSGWDSETRKLQTFQAGIPALDAFPFEVWSRLVSRRWKSRSVALLDYGPPAGFGPLRREIASYLRTTRAVRCEPDQVIVVPGSRQAIDLVARILLDRGDAVWLEDPGYPAARDIFKAVGARIIAVPVGEAGLDIAAGRAQCPDCPDARLAYVTPSHQFPLGMMMTLARRLELLEWAGQAGAWIVEDDYDSEFRFAGRPLAALQGLDRHGCVLYLGSFSKVLFPALRLGYMIVPSDLVDAFLASRRLLDTPSLTLHQAVVAEFMAEGHFARHIRRMRALYEERKDILVAAAERDLDGLLELSASASGMHLIAWLQRGLDDRHVAHHASGHGVTVTPLSTYAISPPRRHGLLLGFSAFDAGKLRAGVRRLGTALRETVARSTKP
jgi:GntR family transcriptional regulator/MocR family aminotransferase